MSRRVKSTLGICGDAVEVAKDYPPAALQKVAERADEPRLQRLRRQLSTTLFGWGEPDPAPKQTHEESPDELEADYRRVCQEMAAAQGGTRAEGWGQSN